MDVKGGGRDRVDKKRVLIALLLVGLLLGSVVVIAYASSCNFVGSKNSDVYHYPDCRYAKNIKSGNRVCFDTPEDAVAAGYRPCKVCTPPSKSPPTPTPTPTPEVIPTPMPSQLPIIEGNSSLPHRLHKGRSPSQLPITEGNLSTDNGTLRIGAFNIQVFGKSKAAKPEVMDVLAKIIRTYDLVAIQEIRDKDQTALPKLVNLVNANGSQYEYIVGPRLGRTSSKEQYAYIYNNQTIKLNGTPETYPEPNGTDPFHREPYIAAFAAANGSFDVTLIVIHTDPDEATEEIYALDAVINYTQNEYPYEQDFIILGDLNADCRYFDEDLIDIIYGSGYLCCINNSVDTTTSATNCTYDRIIITAPAVTDYTGDSGVFRYDLVSNLTEEETKAVSDHYPIYAEFYCDGDIDTPERGGSLSVNSSPLGATIYLDGSYKGKTPRTITEVSPGDHTIKLTLEGYYDWSTSVNAKTGETSYVHAILTPIPTTGTIFVHSSPSGATISLDANDFFGFVTTPWTFTNVPPGHYKLELSLEGYQDCSRSVHVTAGETSDLHEILNPSPTTHIDIVINEVELNPSEDDRRKTTMEWVEIYNPTSNDISLGSWTVSSTQYRGGKTFTLYGTIKANGYYVLEHALWLHNTKGESVILRDADGTEIDRTPMKNDDDNDHYSWQRYPNGKDTWKFRSSTKGSSNGG